MSDQILTGFNLSNRGQEKAQSYLPLILVSISTVAMITMETHGKIGVNWDDYHRDK